MKLEWRTSRYDYASVEVELCLDVHDGTFHAEYEGTWYDAQTKDELLAKIRQAAQKTIDDQLSRRLDVAVQQGSVRLFVAPTPTRKVK